MARPSLCLLLVFTALLAVAFTAPAAHAEQLETILLTKTSPPALSQAEPASTTTPLVFGGEEGTITTVVRSSALRSPRLAVAHNPNAEISIYANSSCEGEPVGTGTLKTLEETGIQVTVPAETHSVLYATESDGVNETSPCPSVGLDYWEGVKSESPPSEPLPPPPAERPANAPVPPRIHTVPGGRANDNSPRVAGSALGAERVKIFTNASCSGSPAANVSPAELTTGVPMHVPDNSVTEFAATSVAGARQSFCSPTATYVEDSTPPHVRITMGPGAKTRRHKAVFRFADVGEEPLGTSFQCRVNHGKWKACRSPLKLRHLGFHRYVLRVRGTDSIGNAGGKPAKRSFKVIP
jgi:hypothetical protein